MANSKPVSPAPAITSYLARWSDGDREAFDAVLPLVESELRRIARRSLRGERNCHTLQATALVNEAWLRLEGERGMRWRDRGHFFAVAAQIMRFLLVDYARRRQAEKRGGDFCRVSLTDVVELATIRFDGLVDLDAALTRLARADERKARVATLRLFAGATVDETADALGVSAITVMRDWRFARAWLKRELRD
jgi:RNA polymerase sigma factor (TIGR02999 family)